MAAQNPLLLLHRNEIDNKKDMVLKPGQTYSAYDSSQESGEKQIAALENFFSRIESQTLFQHQDRNDFRKLRNSLQDALIQLLDHKRPYLEAAKGILWPYEAFRKCTSFFKDRVQSNGPPFQKEESLLFLARFPFPEQWRYLIQAEEMQPDRPEIKELHMFEMDIIQRKINQRAQKTYRIRRFCQILKRPRLPTEKGILRIFSLLYLFTGKGLLEELSRHYVLYVEPTAGVMYRHTWLRVFSRLQDPCIFGVAGKEDTEYIGSQPGIITTELAHADFLQDDVAIRTDSEKEFDLVFIGTYDEMHRKRHQRFLRLLQHPKLERARALVIGQGKEKNFREFIQTVSDLRLSDRVTGLWNRPRKEIPEYLARCRIGVHLALHENGCRCIYEYFRSDLPCVISSYSAGVNFEVFTPQTGLAVPDKDLPDAIRHVLDHRSRFSPRHWFLSHSGSVDSSRRLNRLLKKLFLDWGYEWTEDIVPLGSGGANRYITPDDYEGFRPDFHTLFDILTRKSRFPVRVSVD